MPLTWQNLSANINLKKGCQVEAPGTLTTRPNSNSSGLIRLLNNRLYISFGDAVRTLLILVIVDGTRDSDLASLKRKSTLPFFAW
jgi:hypothetical protein